VLIPQALNYWNNIFIKNSTFQLLAKIKLRELKKEENINTNLLISINLFGE